jgi:hypothetical protein
MTCLVPTHLETEEWAAHSFEFGPVADWEVFANEMPATTPISRGQPEKRSGVLPSSEF